MSSTANHTIARRRVASTTVQVASALVILATAWQAVPAHAADYTWGGGASTWTATNWVTTSGTVTFPVGSSGTNTAIIDSGTVSFAGNDTFGVAGTTSSPVITIGTGATLASNGFFNTIWNLNLGGGTLLANGGVNASFPTYQLAGTLLVNGSTASTMSTGAGSNNMINVGGQGNATLTFDVADVTNSTAADLTVGVILQNGNQAGALTKSGAGTLVLSASNTYTGATTVSGGVLQIASGGALTSAGSVNSISGGQLSIAGSVTMATQTYFAVGNGIEATTGTTSIDGGTLAVGNNAFLIGGGRSGVANAGVGTFVVNSGTVTVGAGGGTAGGQDAFAVWLNPYATPSGTSQLLLNGGVFSTARPISHGGGGQALMAFNGGTLQLGADLPNINNFTTLIHSGGAVFDTNTFGGTLSQVLATGTGATAGGLTKIGSGTLTLSAANTFTGTTRINAGVLSITNASGLQNSTLDMNALDSGTITFAQNSTIGGLTGSRNLDMDTRTLSFGNNNQSTTYSGTLSNGAFTKVGSGTLTLTAEAATSGATTVSGGVLALSGGNNRLSGSSAIMLSGGTLDLGGNSQTTSAVVGISGVSGLTSGTLTSTQLSTSYGPSGTLTLGPNAAFVANLASQRLLMQGISLNLTGSVGSSMNYGGDESSAANYIGVDSGGLASVTVNGPTLNFQIAAGQANATGGWLRIGANSNAIGVVNLQSGTVNVGHSASLAAFFNNGGNATASSGTLTITGGAFNVGTGTLTTTFGGANGYLYLINDNVESTGNAIVNLDGGLLSVKRIVPGTGGGTKQVNFNGGTLTAAASDASFMNAATGFTVNVGNAGATIDSGTFAITVGAALAANGSGGLAKSGAGTLTLAGANTYTGATTISAGRLALGAGGSFANSASIIVGNAGSSGAVLDLTAKTGAFAIGAGQTLSGGGTVQLASSGTLNVQGTFSPGNSPGLFTYEAGTTVLSGTTVMEILGTSRATSPSHGSGFYDAVNVAGGGTLQLGGLLTFDFSQAFADNTTFDLFSTVGGSSLTGNFTGVNVIGAFYTGLTWNQASGVWKSTNTVGGQSLEFSSATGQLVIVPEPGALALAGLGIAAAAWAVRRRK